jgi:TorA maturation chaperone TorD
MDGSLPDDPPRDDLLRRFCEAAAADLLTLASLHHAEADNALLSALAARDFPDSLGLKLFRQEGQEAMSFMKKAIVEYAPPLSPELQDELAADYAAIYLNHDYSASPFESVWLDEDKLIMQAPMFQVREIYKKHGLGVSNWRTRSEDHLVVELQFLAWLMLDTNEMNLREAATFMDEHLLRWLPAFAERVIKRCSTPFYAGAAWLTSAYCDEFRDMLAGILGESRPSREDIETRMRPKQVAQPVPVKFVPGASPSW